MTPTLIHLLFLSTHALANAPSKLVVIDTLPTTLLPLYARTDAEHRAAALLFEPLYYQSAIGSDLTSKLVRAYRLETAPEPALELELEPTALWADGHPIDGEDVCFTIAAWLLPTNPVPDSSAHRSRIASCTVGPDAKTATVHFRRAVPDPRHWLQLALMPAHAFKDASIPPEHPFAHAAFGSKGRTAVLEDNRLNITSTAKRGPLQHIEVRADPLPNPTSPTVRVRSSRTPPLDNTPEGLQLRSYDSHDIWFVAVHYRGPLADPDVRRALAATIDRPALIETVWGKRYDSPAPITGPFLPSSPLHNRSVSTPPAPAGTLPQEPLKMGIREADAALEPRLAPALLAQLQAQGLTVTLVEVPGDAAVSAPLPATVNELDLMLVRWTVPPTDHVGEVVAQEGRYNPFHTADTTALRLFDTLDHATTFTAERDAAHALHAHLQDGALALWLTTGVVRSEWPEVVPRVPLQPGWYWTELR